MYTITFPDKTILHIEDSAIKKLFRYVQKHKADLEAGGILLGKRYQAREEYIVSDISEPDKRDIRSRFAFVRNKCSAQRIINQLWAESNGIVEAQSPVFPRLKRSRCRSSQEVNDSPTPFSALNYC